jgi:hypothetical protein
VVPKTNDAVALFGKIRRAPSVATKPDALAVLLTVELDDEPQGVIREIRDIRADRGLAPEMSLWHFDKTQGTPEAPLGRRRVVTKRACTWRARVEAA